MQNNTFLNVDYYGINGMPVVENYIETDEYRLFEKKINTCKAALIKGKMKLHINWCTLYLSL